MAVWPKVSASYEAKFDKSYSQLKQASDAGLVEVMKALGGQKWQLVKLEPGAAINEAKPFRLVQGPAVTVRGADGAEKTIRPVGAILQQDGSFKVSTYYATPQHIN